MKRMTEEQLKSYNVIFNVAQGTYTAEILKPLLDYIKECHAEIDNMTNMMQTALQLSYLMQIALQEYAEEEI